VARRTVSLIAKSRFVMLVDSRHLVMPQEPTWQRARSEIKAFLADPRG
jgi:hypothetical protein